MCLEVIAAVDEQVLNNIFAIHFDVITWSVLRGVIRSRLGRLCIKKIFSLK